MQRHDPELVIGTTPIVQKAKELAFFGEWVGADEARSLGLVNRVVPAPELLPVQATVAVADQLHRHRVDARVARQLAQGELGQLAVVVSRQVLAHVADLGRDQVVVVEQPLRGRRHELPAVHVLGQAQVRLAQHPCRLVAVDRPAPVFRQNQVKEPRAAQRYHALLRLVQQIDDIDVEFLLDHHQRRVASLVARKDVGAGALSTILAAESGGRTRVVLQPEHGPALELELAELEAQYAGARGALRDAEQDESADVQVHGRADLFHQAIPTSRVVLIEEAGHRPAVEQPAAFTAAAPALALPSSSAPIARSAF